MMGTLQQVWSTYQYRRLVNTVEKFSPEIKAELGLTNRHAIAKHVKKILQNGAG